MTASRDTRYHEAAHAVAAHVLGIGLKEEGMILHSDSDAWVEVVDRPPDDAGEDWFIRRVAVKLAGPLAMCRQRREPHSGMAVVPSVTTFDLIRGELWDTLRCTREYAKDVNDSKCKLRCYWTRVGGCGSNDLIDEQMDRSARMALACVEENETTISAVADAAEGRDEFSRSEIVACIQACQQKA